jgi:RNA polymerase sigma-70 factor (ECF subfamily)
MGLLQSGDHLAFAEIYNRYKLILHHHAWSRLGNKTEAQDTIQEVFSALWSKRETITLHHNLSGYLYTSVRNHILNLIARKDVQSKYINSMQQLTPEQVLPDHRVRENMLQLAIEKEIASLPPKMRQVFELSRKQHLSNKEIAAIMGTSEQTVKKQISNTLKQLRSRLGLLTYLYMLFFFKG